MKPGVDANLGPIHRSAGEWAVFVDAIVGARIGIDLSKTVVLGIQGDVGGFNIGNSNKFAWTQITSLSWDFSQSKTFSLGYKFLEVKHESGGDSTLKVQIRGPFLATSVRF